MRPACSSGWSAAIVALAFAALADARSATVKETARLRVGPSASTDLLGEVPEGTTIEIVGESGGWRQVQTADGQTGYIWSDHLIEGDTGARSAESARRDGGAQRSLLDEIRGLRDEMAALRAQPGPVTAADLDRLRAEVQRLASAQQVVARRLDERLLPATDAPPPEAPLSGLGPLIFALGGAFGWAASRMVRRRRDHRQRNRIRI